MSTLPSAPPSPSLRLKVAVDAENLLRRINAHATLGVLSHPLLEEVRFALQTDHLHPLERVLRVVQLGHAQALQKAVRAELNVLAHNRAVHANELHRERITHKLLLNNDCVANDRLNPLVRELVHELGVHEAREVAVKPLVPGDELVGEAEAGHEAALLEPEDGAEGAGEEDSLHGRERDAPLGEGGVLGIAPLERPVRLALDARDGLDRVEEVVLLSGVLDVRVDQERVRLGVDVLDGDLEPVEAASLGDGHLGGEVGREVLVHNAVGGSEERQNVRYEVALVGSEPLPVLGVVGEVDLGKCVSV